MITTLRWMDKPDRQPSNASPSVTDSPYTYTNVSGSAQLGTVSGGVVTDIELDTGGGFASTGLLLGVWTLLQGQALRISYLVNPPTFSTVTLG